MQRIRAGEAAPQLDSSYALVSFSKYWFDSLQDYESITGYPISQGYFENVTQPASLIHMQGGVSAQPLPYPPIGA